MIDHRMSAELELIGLDRPVAEEELRRLCRLEREHLLEWIAEGVISPQADPSGPRRFSARQVVRARLACRLQRDLELETEALPLVLDLLEEVHSLRRQVRLLARLSE